jgi:hypothetical protein
MTDNLNGETEKLDQSVQEFTKKDLLYHFLLFRFVGSIVLFLATAGLAGLFDSKLMVNLGVLAAINILIQLYYLLKASIAFLKRTKKVEKLEKEQTIAYPAEELTNRSFAPKGTKTNRLSTQYSLLIISLILVTLFLLVSSFLILRDRFAIQQDKINLLLKVDSLENEIRIKQDSISQVIKNSLNIEKRYKDYWSLQTMRAIMANTNKASFEDYVEPYVPDIVTRKNDSPSTKYLPNNVTLLNAEKIELLNLKWDNNSFGELISASVYNKTNDSITGVLCDFVIKDAKGRPVDSGTIAFSIIGNEMIPPNLSKVCNVYRTPLKKQENQAAIITIKKSY